MFGKSKEFPSMTKKSEVTHPTGNGKLITLRFKMDDGHIKEIVNVDVESFQEFCNRNSHYDWITFNDVNVNLNKVQYYYQHEAYDIENRKDPKEEVKPLVSSV